jgi:hypothetical protein
MNVGTKIEHRVQGNIMIQNGKPFQDPRREQVCKQVWDQVRDQVKAQAYNKSRDRLIEETG